MGCDNCDSEQLNPQVLYFLRVGGANVQVLGCHEHVSELRRLYLLGLDSADELKGLEVPQAMDRPPRFNANLIAHNICPECGISWNQVSRNCPKMLFNRHPLAP